jgi:farnesyl diphosphate synthase
MSAINDGVLLKCHVQAIIKRYFKEKLYALDLMELWNEVINGKHPCQQFLSKS